MQKRDWEMQQLDVKTAFLHGDLEEAIYMYQPEGYVKKGDENKVCLKVALLDMDSSKAQGCGTGNLMHIYLKVALLDPSMMIVCTSREEVESQLHIC